MLTKSALGESAATIAEMAVSGARKDCAYSSVGNIVFKPLSKPQ
jgi:hypothetical protein